jgi:hypothetical protein
VKTTVEIADAEIEAARKLTGATSEQEAVVRAVRGFIRERAEREAKVNGLFGSMPRLMTQEQLRAMREGRDWKTAK